MCKPGKSFAVLLWCVATARNRATNGLACAGIEQRILHANGLWTQRVLRFLCSAPTGGAGTRALSRKRKFVSGECQALIPKTIPN